jgi:hypothetical protein
MEAERVSLHQVSTQLQSPLAQDSIAAGVDELSRGSVGRPACPVA